ncbi:flagellar biosynthesis protein FliQ [Nitrospira sp. Kam-Ns4a]
MDLWDSLIRMVAALAVVLGVLLLGWGVARRVLGRIGAADPEGPLVQVLGTGSLGPRREVFVVAVAGEVLVLGATATSLVPLGRIRDPERVARLLAQRARPRPAAGSGAGLAAVAAWSGAGAGRLPRRRRGTSVSQDAAGTSKLVRQCTRGARLAVAAVAVVTGVGAGSAWAGSPSLTLDLGGGPGATATVIQLLALLTVLSLAPAFFIMVTAFTRIVIVLAFLRQAIGAPQVPPNQVLISLALFLTFFVMAPVWDRVSETALQPFLAEQITHEEALARGLVPIREFMLRQVREKDLELFVEAGQAAEAGPGRRAADACDHSGVHPERIADRVPDRVLALHSLPDRGHGRRERPDVHGDDAAPAGRDLAAVQADPVRARGRLVSGGGLDAEEFSLARSQQPRATMRNGERGWKRLVARGALEEQMTPETVIEIGRRAIETMLLVSAPMLGLSLLVGLLVGLVQAVTQINEATLTFVPKVLAVVATAFLFLPWMLELLISFTTATLGGIPEMVR